MRNWEQAKKKLLDEPRCRVCKGVLPDPAHIIPRSRIPNDSVMDKRNIVPLCRKHHSMFDSHKLDLLPYLTLEEQSFIVGLVGIYEAYIRVTDG